MILRFDSLAIVAHLFKGSKALLAEMQILVILVLILSLAAAEDCTCGIEKVRNRIIKGRASQAYRMPWVVHVSSPASSCTGSLISPTFVLTAAHCVPKDASAANVFVSTYQGCEKWRLWGDYSRKHSVKQVIRHPGFTGFHNGNDISLLELNYPITHVMPVCLPKQPITHFSNLVSSGWGMVANGVTKAPSTCLNEADLTPVSDLVCRQRYGIPIERVMCAGGDAGTCQGDSGGPLMTRVNGLVIQAGISSFARSDCGIVSKEPSGFEKVTAHVDWLRQHGVPACYK